MTAPAPRSPLRRKLREQVADSILDAAEEIALELGVGGLTISAVADRAGVAVGTLYNYFPGGEGILTALFRARRNSLLPLISSAATATKGLPFELRLRDFVRRLLIAFESHERFLRIAVLVDRDGNKSKPRDTALMTRTVNALEQIMREGARRKLFAMRQAPVYARMMHGALRSLYLWRMCSGAEPISVDGDLLVDTFLHGIMP
ncbi:MAG TPA: TetR/AcrR family transcriptional regulator [Kofleriaceae bacterium]|jgi:AcrR family transcriptional regulator|nr:TetR/AcrR family transcriptional regulator [Kofleriaceae bacterium]